MTKKKKDPYKATLCLPKTQFSMRANLIQSEPQHQKRWAKMDLYKRIQESEHPKGTFLLHDGPPYANGSIHMGHLLNKVLKDIVVRNRTMAGYEVPFVPGWDCHGLPIEHKVLQELGEKAKTLVPLQIRHRCAKYAEKYVKLQGKQMKSLGTVGDYDDPYITMKPRYEGAVLELFADLVKEGIVYRALRPVHWSIANQTALAEAELEYYDREDISVYVEFEVENKDALPTSLNVPEGEKVSLMIWTTTPWTLPANLAVAVSAPDTYGLYKVENNDKTSYVVLGEALSEKIFTAAGAGERSLLGTCTGQELRDASITYKHPFIDRSGPVLTAEYVTLTDGTGMVHTAPGHGAEDYQTGLREGLDIYCPVQADGTFDRTAPEWLQGEGVWSANQKVVDHLRESGHLFYDHLFDHSYPHDWRSKTPTIFRATDQWFIGVDHKLKENGETLRGMAQAKTQDGIRFVPEWGKNRLAGMLESRPDWCISRQRSWGLPIPAFHHPSGEVLLTVASVRAVAQKIREEGSNAWFREEPGVLLSHYDVQADPDAPQALKDAGDALYSELHKGNDIFDVWFESGASWHAVLQERGMGYPADLYLEGSDQHRGWFQLSLLPALGATKQPPFHTVLTHGFMVAADGRKMSKSLGNAIEVEELLKKYGADICRWWVSSLNYTNDIKVDWKFFKVASEEYRKVRNTIRFMLGNLAGFNPETDRYEMTEDDKGSLDAWANQELQALLKQVYSDFENYQFRRVNKGIFDFCNDKMSAVYLAAIKDRLYCEAVDSVKRRRTQTVLFDIVNALILLSAPVLVHTAEEAFLSLHHEKMKESDRTVHTQLFPEIQDLGEDTNWEDVMQLRERVMKALEEAKEAQGINYPLDAGIELTVSEEDEAKLKPYADEFADLFGVSRCTLQAGEAGIQVLDLREEPRCARSWKRDGTVKERSDGGLLSDRDAQVLGV